MAKKKRTKAERSAAAVAAWARRREKATLAAVKQDAREQDRAAAKEARETPDRTMAMSVLEKMPLYSEVDNGIPGVVREGESIFLTLSHRDGSHTRQRVSESGARKLFKELGAILL